MLQFASSRGVALLGETAVFHCDGELTAARLSAGGSIDAPGGHFLHEALLGKPYGSRAAPAAARDTAATALKMPKSARTCSSRRETPLIVKPAC